MKTKFTIVLTALFLLVGICANAQVKNQTPKRAESETPIKGDVNGDGRVDVADIAAIIEIMKNNGGGDGNNYFYVGTTKPTSLSECTVVDEYPAEQFYTTTTRGNIYVLTNSNKTVTFKDDVLGGEYSQNTPDTSSIAGYTIYSQAGRPLSEGTTIKILISEK